MRRAAAAIPLSQRGRACDSFETCWRLGYASSRGEKDEEQSVPVDRTGLQQPVEHSHLPTGVGKEAETTMARILKSLIRFRGGPITIAEYMSEVLTNPTAGYYMKRDVFGRAGDFTTSPEISQLFGEMIGAWCALQWFRIGRPERLLLVELGPGRGTLMQDLLRGTSTIPGFASAAEIHFVEVSDALRKVQHETLKCKASGADQELTNGSNPTATTRMTGATVSWHRSLDEVPKDAPAVFIAHEFFDALPAHQFRRTDRGWREKLVDVAPDDSPLHLSLALAPGPTPASKLLLEPRLRAVPGATRDKLQEIEISPQSIAMAQALAHRVASQDGAALIIDYGQEDAYGSSLQAIHQHKFVPLLSRPGEADLSCRVDFSALRQGVEESGAAATAHGTLPQAHFLAGLGIQTRLEELLKTASEEEQSSLVSGYIRLLDYRNPDGTSPFDETEQTSERTSNAGSAQPESLPADSTTEAEERDQLEDEGMGMAYKVLAIVPKRYAAPIPFPGWQEQ